MKLSHAIFLALYAAGLCVLPGCKHYTYTDPSGRSVGATVLGPFDTKINDVEVQTPDGGILRIGGYDSNGSKAFLELIKRVPVVP